LALAAIATREAPAGDTVLLDEALDERQIESMAREIDMLAYEWYGLIQHEIKTLQEPTR
jgi:hypothetical protein